MSDLTESRIFHVLKHDLRRRVLHVVEEGPASYTELLRATGVESGLLAYHLRSMEGLLEKDGEGRYVLSSGGAYVIDLLEGGDSGAPVATGHRDRLVKLALVALIVCSIAFNASLLASLRSVNVATYIDGQKVWDETELLVDEGLSMVYAIYNDQRIARGIWTDLLLKLVDIRYNLMEIEMLTKQEGASSYEAEATHLKALIDEFTLVLKNEDADYVRLTWEKRYLVREAHSLLLDMDEHQGSPA